MSRRTTASSRAPKAPWLFARECRIFPPGFVPGQRRLSVAEQTLRNMLERRMGKMLTDRLGGQAFTLPGKADKVGELAATSLATERGWLVLALARTGKPAKPETADKVALTEQLEVRTS